MAIPPLTPGARGSRTLRAPFPPRGGAANRARSDDHEPRNHAVPPPARADAPVEPAGAEDERPRRSGRETNTGSPLHLHRRPVGSARPLPGSPLLHCRPPPFPIPEAVPSPHALLPDTRLDPRPDPRVAGSRIGPRQPAARRVPRPGRTARSTPQPAPLRPAPPDRPVPARRLTVTRHPLPDRRAPSRRPTPGSPTYALNAAPQPADRPPDPRAAA